MREMIFEAKKAKILLLKNDFPEIVTFLKNIGSNFILKDKKLGFEGKIGWRARAAGEPYPNWRRGWDSNPQAQKGHRFSRPTE